MSAEFDVDVVVDEVSDDLGKKFPDADPAHVRAVVREEVELLQDGTVSDYVSVLSARAAKKRLKAAAR